MGKLWLGNRSGLLHTAASLSIAALLLMGLYLTSLHSYLLFHSLIESFTITVAAGIFVIAWNARRYLNNNYLLFVGTAFLFVALMDLIHTLAYKGMGVFADQTGNLPTQLWVAARYLQCLSLLIAPFFLGRKLKVYLQIAAYSLVTALLLASIFYWRIFPVAYVDGVGLTAFKKNSEYVISFFFLASIGLLFWKRRAFDPGVLRFLTVFLVLTIASEIAFSSYVSVYGGANLIGHLLRLVAFYFLYKAIIETGLVRPYAILLRGLKLSEQQLRQDAAALQAANEELKAYDHTVAHNLKNPLTVIITVSDLINNVSNLTREELKDCLLQIKSTAFEMDGIIDNLLLFSEVRNVDAPLEAVDMAKAVAHVRGRLNYMIKERRARITCPAAWPMAMGYLPWIEEVWANFLSNALKYGGRSPCVELGADCHDKSVRFWVRDHGQGIPPEEQVRLFQPFTQFGKVHKPGHGLGLSIVLQIIGKLGGQVGVESRPGQGSLFYFTLPAAPAGRAEKRGMHRAAKKMVPKAA